MFKMEAEEMKMHIEKGGLVSFSRGEIKLNCVRGTLWVTWPGSGDVILRDGDEISVRQHGKLCVTSLTGSFVSIKRRAIFPCLKEIPGIAAVKLFKSAVSSVRNGGEQSVFGDSVHSITR